MEAPIKNSTALTIVGPVSPYRGGIALHTDRLSEELQVRGFDVVVESWSHQYPKNLYRGFQPRVIGQRECPSVYFQLSWRNPVSWLRVGIRNRGRKFVLIGVTPFQFPIYVLILLFGGALFNRKSVLLAHNVIPHESSIFDRALTKFLYRRLGAVVTHSETELEAAKFFTDRVSRCALPFHATLEKSAPSRSGVTKNLLFVGFVREYKGVDLLIEALTMVPQDISLIIAGEFWDPLERYIALCKHYEVEHRVSLIDGFVEDHVLAELFNQADALILPYRNATSTQLPKLGRSRGVPSIVTPVGGLPETISPGLDGLVTPGLSPREIAQTVEKLYENDLLMSLKAGCDPPDESSEWDCYLSTFVDLRTDCS